MAAVKVKVKIRGGELYRRRVEMGVKPGAFAKDVGISYPHLKNIENGNRGASIELVHRLARRLECEPSDLLEDAA